MCIHSLYIEVKFICIKVTVISRQLDTFYKLITHVTNIQINKTAFFHLLITLPPSPFLSNVAPLLTLTAEFYFAYFCLYVKWIIQLLLFRVWLLSLNILFVGYILSSQLLCEHTLLLHSTVDVHLDTLYSGPIRNNSAMNILLHYYLLVNICAHFSWEYD